MRPIAKGIRPDGYRFPLSIASQHKFDLDAAELDWYFTSPEVTILWGAYPTYLQLVDGLKTLARWHKVSPVPKNITDLKAIKALIETRLGDDGYKQASPFLLERTGKICSYCEQFLASEVDVDHCVPKATVPATFIVWQNLVYACKTCNGSGSGKGVKPVYATALPWAQEGKSANYSPTEIELYRAVRKRYIWPDRDADAYRSLMPALEYRDQKAKKWRLIKDSDSVGPSIALSRVEPLTRKVFANLCISSVKKGKLSEYQIRVAYQAVGEKAERSKDLFGLDNRVATSERDFREYNATREWLDAVYLLQLFAKTAKNKKTKKPDFDAAFELLLYQLHSRSFFSVWTRVAELILGASTVPGGKTKVFNKLLMATKSDLIWPGTDLDGVLIK